jgi:hypothetical protein
MQSSTAFVDLFVDYVASGQVWQAVDWNHLGNHLRRLPRDIGGMKLIGAPPDITTVGEPRLARAELMRLPVILWERVDGAPIQVFAGDIKLDLRREAVTIEGTVTLDLDVPASAEIRAAIRCFFTVMVRATSAFVCLER